jgi:hypothetical protein
MRASLVAALLVIAAAHAARAQTELANDSYEPGGSAGFQQGFVAGEIAAVRLVPPGSPLQVRSVRFLFGGAAGERNVVLSVWEDAAQTTAPGAELFSDTFAVTPSDDVLQEIDLTGEQITVSGPFRVGIGLTASGTPSVARDTDGTIAAARNFVLAEGLGWRTSSFFGVTGDWVIRARVPEARASWLGVAVVAALARIHSGRGGRLRRAPR